MKILITGARSGIAYQVALKLAQNGHLVYLTTHTNNQAIAINKKIKSLKLNIVCFKLDITLEEDRKLINKLDLDVLINHAGIGMGGSIVDMNIETVKENFEVNVFSTYRLIQLFYRDRLKKQKPGKIFIMSSIASMIPISYLGSYCATKAAISTLAITLKKELKQINSNITISLIEPGAYKTGFNQVMIENKEKYLRKDSIFYKNIFTINQKMQKMFSIIEKKSLNSIVNKIVREVEKAKPSFKIRTPFLQIVGAKLYLLFYR